MILDKIISGVWGYVAIAALVALLAGGLVYSGYSHGIAIGDAKLASLRAEYSAASVTQSNKQNSDNQAAKEREAVTLAILAAQSEALAQKTKELSDAADNDPNRDSRCLSDDSRVRIDSYH